MNDIEALKEYFGAIPEGVTFTRRPESITGDRRTAWRLAVICMLLRRGRADALSLQHLHILWWAIRTSRTRDLLVRWQKGTGSPEELIVRFDPSLNAALDLALGQGLVERTASGVKLTPSGLTFAEDLEAAPDVLTVEKEFLAQFPRSITQKHFSDLLEWK